MGRVFGYLYQHFRSGFPSDITSKSPLVKLSSLRIISIVRSTPQAGKTLGSRRPSRPLGAVRRGSQATPSAMFREEMLFVSLLLSLWCSCSPEFQAGCVGLGTREGADRLLICLCLACRDVCSAGQPRPWPELLSHLGVGPAAFCCRDIERSVVASARIYDGRIGGFGLPFSSEFRAVLGSATYLHV